MYKIIIADDDKIIRSRLVTRIDWNSMGFEVIDDAANGKELLKKTMDLRPDVVITDIKMPLMDGIEFVKEIKKSDFDIEVVVFTGYAEFEYAHKLLQLGVYDYILKPLNKVKLKKCMESLYKKIVHSKSEYNFGNVILKDTLKSNTYFLEYSKEKKFINEFSTGKLENVLSIVESIHKKMITDKISLERIRQSYMYLFNSVYRMLIESKKVNDKINRSIRTLFENFETLDDEKKVYDFVVDLIKNLMDEISKIHDDCTNIYLKKALEYIDKHFSENISMAEIANCIDVSYGYLSYVFNENIDGGFVHSLRKRRIEEAKKLLANTNLKIYEIAHRSGFINSRYFSEIFSSEEGLTPGEYRNKNFKK